MPFLNVFGELERFATEQLYPYRYVITPLVIAALLGAAYLAYRAGAHLWVRRNLALSAVVGVPLAIVAIVAGNYLFSPLWERSTLEEESPLLAASPVVADATETPPGTTPLPDATPEASSDDGAIMSTPELSAPPEMSEVSMEDEDMEDDEADQFEPSTVYTGVFTGADDFHFGRGDALIIEVAPGSFVLRFEAFSVRNGPDLHVYLSEDPTGESVDEALNLGGLKATDGAFNYEIPAHIDVAKMKSAVVWCRQFSTLFTHAELLPAQ